MSFTEFKQKFNVRGTILDYNRVIYNIPQVWKDKMNTSEQYLAQYNMTIGMSLKCILKQKKGCRNIYKVFISNIERTDLDITAHTKWEDQLGQLYGNWEGIYTAMYQCTSDSNLLDFQYRIIHRILVTNRSLVRFGIQESEMCSYCGQEQETLQHLFIDCPHVSSLWTSLQAWLNSILNLRNPVKLTTAEILFGSQQPNFELINFITLLGKKYIYQNKFSSRNVTIDSFKALLKYRFNSEKCIARKNNKIEEFFQKWVQLYYHFNE